MRLTPLQKFVALFRRKPTPVTEDHKAVLESWKKEAGSIKTPRQLARFVRKLTRNYQHDYGTIIHAMDAAMSAAMHVVDSSPQGGITGFQASCLGWQQVERYFSVPPGTPMRLVDYSDMLYPQYADKFRPVISKATWKWLQQEAQRIRADKGASPQVKAHLDSILAGQVPFGYSVAV